MVILIIENDIKDRFNIEDSFNIHLPELKVITGAYSNCFYICKNRKPQLFVLNLNIPDVGCS